ncbi:unnamed protein product, partial [Heterosigma akashiwo]
VAPPLCNQPLVLIMSPNQDSHGIVLILNCAPEVLSSLEKVGGGIPVFEYDDVAKASSLADLGSCVALKTAPWLESFIKHGIQQEPSQHGSQNGNGYTAGNGIKEQLREVKQMAAALDEMNKFCQELEEANTLLVEQSMSLLDCMLERSALVPSLDPDCTENETRVGQYELGDVVGRGTTGTIRSCVNMSGASKRPYAIKILDKRPLAHAGGFSALENEIKALRRLNSPRVVRLFEVLNAPGHVYLLLERCQNDLFEFLQ